uniref:U53-Deinotoxin-Dsu1a_1 n=1 Tax=Deinopis subrufa TaxID=1905329 RepID=A0A4Q8KBY7_DEISU
MIFFYVFIAASVLALSMGNDEYPLDPALRASIEEKLTKYDALEKTFKSIYAPEQLRDDENCLPVGAKRTCQMDIQVPGIQSGSYTRQHWKLLQELRVKIISLYRRLDIPNKSIELSKKEVLSYI